VVQHNTYRARHGVPALSWNSTLASSAQALAGIVAARGCAPQYPGYYINGPGANIAFGFWDFSAVVQAWYDEGLHYDYTADSYNFATWDFTQLVGPHSSWPYLQLLHWPALAVRPITGPGVRCTTECDALG